MQGVIDMDQKHAGEANGREQDIASWKRHGQQYLATQPKVRIADLSSLNSGNQSLGFRTSVPRPTAFEPVDIQAQRKRSLNFWEHRGTVPVPA
ncbi:hypothetical protein H4R34_001371 [Dimargaris verticillata]|uniref:Uncharacterized protein n=1 Tax=Dimargaris verticillata TaxID=2761393 RepID=A0A9W8EF19_9FUNG|nr:hypothetical protein H4R34_001371 [Dimargaris verticillata]